MTLKERVQKAVDIEANSRSSVSREKYEDDYDGFTHCTYSGLVDETINTIYDEGIEDTVTDKEIASIVFDLF